MSWFQRWRPKLGFERRVKKITNGCGEFGVLYGLCDGSSSQIVRKKKCEEREVIITREERELERRERELTELSMTTWAWGSEDCFTKNNTVKQCLEK